MGETTVVHGTRGVLRGLRPAGEQHSHWSERSEKSKKGVYSDFLKGLEYFRHRTSLTFSDHFDSIALAKLRRRRELPKR